jgi:CRISPR system Cascade subunit CasD
MPTYLTFALAAPIGAMGDLAVGERRSSWDRPGRSAVLGLIAACLGLDRADEAAHRDLEQGYGLAMRIERLGPLLADYHTAQVPPRRRNHRFATRAEELAADDLETILSRRDYRADLVVLCALWPRGSARWTLDAVADALTAPHFAPYFGRKACPLGLPMKPMLFAHDDPVAALAARAAEGPERGFVSKSQPREVVLDRADVPAGMQPSRIELRRDALVSRARWQFALREEAVIAVGPAS